MAHSSSVGGACRAAAEQQPLHVGAEPAGPQAVSVVSAWLGPARTDSAGGAAQVAAVDKPQVHLYETGVMRITRHPQAFGQVLPLPASPLCGGPVACQISGSMHAPGGSSCRGPALWGPARCRRTMHARPLRCAMLTPGPQALWCLAHSLWIGSSFTLVTSGLLMAHHAFGCWHGDLRLRRQHGQVGPDTA